MKYMLLAYTKQTSWDDVDPASPEFLELCRFYEDLGRELTGSGELVVTEGLAHPTLSRTVRPGGEVVDGPFAEAKEVLVSFAIVDCAGHDRVTGIAARISAATGDAVEIRPLMDGSAEPALP
ncbi:MAG: YciI family protein [Pseudonocardia sp.]|nr:YciI family protein [Pseudonocardia sp.]